MEFLKQMFSRDDGLVNNFVECDSYTFYPNITFTNKDIWNFIKMHTRLIDLLNPRKVSAISQFVLYVLLATAELDPETVKMREDKNWKFKFDKNWKIK